MNTFNLKPILKFFSLLYFLFLFVGSVLGQFPQIGGDILGDNQYDALGQATSINSDGKVVAVGIPARSVNNNLAEVQVYQWQSNMWIQRGLGIEGNSINDNWASSVGINDDGTIVVAGAPYDNGNGSNSGHVRVYEWNGTAWNQRGLDIEGDCINDNIGHSVSINGNGNVIAIGAPYNDRNGLNSGHVRIYEWNGTAWIQRGLDIEGNGMGDFLGYSVSINSNGNIVAMGAPYNDGNGSNSGHVRIYEWNGIAWVQRGLDIEGEVAEDQSGLAVSINGDGSIVAIGAPHNDGYRSSCGHVRIHEWNGLSWVQKGTDIDGEEVYDKSGSAVSINRDGHLLVIGAADNGGPGGNTIDAGHARVYKWSGIDWAQSGTDIDGEAAADYSGRSVSISKDGRTTIIGSPGSDKKAFGAGQARVFKLAGITGNTYLDLNQNCQQEILETGVANRTLIINPGNITVQTTQSGYWGIDSLPTGIYTITTDTNSSNNYQPCAASYTFTVTNPYSLIQAPSIGYQATGQCTSPDIAIHAPFLRPGFSNQKIYVQACNDYDATAVLDSAYAVVTLDSLLTVNAASMSYTSLGNNQYRVDLDSLYPGQCANFWFDCTLSQSAILGSSLCMDARLYPVDACVLDTIPNSIGIACNTTYDNSHLNISSTCTINDTISFTITNTGSSMTCWSEVRLYVDTIQISTDSVQLISGQSQLFSYAGDGRTWRMEVDQHPLHPGNSQPSTTIELCGNVSNWTSNLVNVFPQDDADPIVDVYCGLVTGSYDPNDKTGYPLGVGTTHDILPNQKMEYRIRFQNTGTDTAFTVVIRDTLSTDFDIFSVQSGVSSHPYTFRMYGPRILEWTFNNIMLPDSNVNEPLSNGFVLFEVNQQPNLAEGTVLENSAGIYFDFNAPIITNISQHTINRFLRSTVITTVENMNEDTDLDIQLYPNPTTGIVQLQRTTTERIQIQVIDQLGRVLIEQETSQQSATMNMSRLPKGLYFVHINDGQKSITKKIVKE